MLLRFLKHPDASSFNITVLVRSPEKAEKLKAFGVNPVIGSHSDTPLVEELTAQADVVIAAVRTRMYSVYSSTESRSLSRKADSDDLVAAKAALKGLKTRYQKTGIAPIFINTVHVDFRYPKVLTDPQILIVSLALVRTYILWLRAVDLHQFMQGYSPTALRGIMPLTRSMTTSIQTRLKCSLILRSTEMWTWN